MFDDRITEEQYLIGESNGISRNTVYQRWANYGWDIERAVTEPVRKPDTGWSEWKEIALKNGVSNPIYCNRLKSGLTREQAATTPVQKHGGNPKKRKWKVNE